MSITRTSPACALPGAIQSPGLAAWKVAVAPARTAAPCDLAGRGVDAARHVACDDDSASGPGRVDRLDRAGGGLTRLAREAGAEDRIDDPGGAVERTGDRTARAACPEALVVGPRVAPQLVGQPSSSTRASRPSSRSSRAATNPSPPLLPLPHTTAISPVGASCWATSASPAPARSISSRPGIPSSPIAHSSSARCCAASGSGSSQSGTAMGAQRTGRPTWFGYAARRGRGREQAADGGSVR